MNVPVAATKRTSSRLLDALRTLEGEKGTGRVGFRTREGAGRPKAGVVVSLPSPSPALVAAARRLPIDAVEVPVGTTPTPPMDQNALDLPLGAHVPVETGVLEPAAGAAYDWLRFDLHASLAGYGQTQAACFLTVPVEYEQPLAPALNSALADALVLQVQAPSRTAFTYDDAIRLRMWREAVRKPLLLACTADGWLLPAALIRDLGLDGVLISVTSERDLEQVEAYRRDLARAEA